MVEVKESCPLGERQDTLARISYQRFSAAISGYPA